MGCYQHLPGCPYDWTTRRKKTEIERLQEAVAQLERQVAALERRMEDVVIRPMSPSSSSGYLKDDRS
jgi:hypothetical protein